MDILLLMHVIVLLGLIAYTVISLNEKKVFELKGAKRNAVALRIVAEIFGWTQAALGFILVVAAAYLAFKEEALGGLSPALLAVVGTAQIITFYPTMLLLKVIADISDKE